jgi:hypothetical protein
MRIKAPACHTARRQWIIGNPFHGVAGPAGPVRLTALIDKCAQPQVSTDINV